MQAAHLKLTFRMAQDLQELRGLMVRVYLIQSGGAIAAAVREEGQKYSAECARLGRGHDLGPPGHHKFRGLLAAFQASQNMPELLQAKLLTMDEAMEKADLKEAHALCPTCKLMPAFGGKTAKLELCIADEDVAQVVHKALLHPGDRAPIGGAPPGGLEDTVQKGLSGLNIAGGEPRVCMMCMPSDRNGQERTRQGSGVSGAMPPMTFVGRWAAPRVDRRRGWGQPCVLAPLRMYKQSCRRADPRAIAGELWLIRI